MNYKYTLIISDENDNEVFNSWCLTEEGVIEELLRKGSYAIKQYEGQIEAEQELAEELRQESKN